VTLVSAPSESETTISISRSDKSRLDKLKIHRREPYREVLGRLLDDIETIKKSGARLPNEPPQTYTSFIKGLIDSTVNEQP
jgi:hypothetical protein